MRKADRKKFQQKLLKLREGFLRQDIQIARDSKSDMDDGIQDSIDFATRSYTKEFLLSLSNLERRQLQQVEAALKRVHTPEYGRCTSCGLEIGPKRLNAAPWVEYCIKCQEEEERGNSRTGRTFSMLEEEPDFTIEE